MRAFLDDQPLAVARPTLAAALAAAVEQAGLKGRVVVEATAGGARIPDETLESPPDVPSGDEVRFISVEPRAMVRVTLLDAADALDSARREQLESARLIQSGDAEAWQAPLGRALETWRAVRDALEKSIELLDAAGRGSGAPRVEDLAGVVGSLCTWLEEVRRALSAEDWSALADALSYEMNDQVERWQGTLRAFADALRPPG